MTDSAATYDHAGYSEEKCVRCGWIMGHPPLNCNNDNTPHVFPSQLARDDETLHDSGVDLAFGVAGRLHNSADAQEWAREWCATARRVTERGDLVIDEGWMIGWFANAIETARSIERAAMVDHAIEVLNRIHEADPTVLQRLVTYRVNCNAAVVDDPEVQVAPMGDSDPPVYGVGLLGILNGAFGIRSGTQGWIAAERDSDHNLTGFGRTGG